MNRLYFGGNLAWFRNDRAARIDALPQPNRFALPAREATEEADRDGVICWPNQMTYKFSPQQIIGINHHYSTITKGSFNEDNVRLLLINLREFLQNSDNKNARGLVNANLLRELGDSVAHTVRTKGEIYGKIEVVQNEWGLLRPIDLSAFANLPY